METPFEAKDDDYALKSRMRKQPVQSRSQKRVELILDTTANLIVKHGLENVTAVFVAEETGLPVGTIYQFFADVDAISTEIIIRTKRRVDKKILDQLNNFTSEDISYEEVVDSFIDIVIEGFRSEPGMTTLVNSLIHTKEYQVSTQITIERLTEAVSNLISVRKSSLSEEKRYLISNIILEGGYRIFEKILTEPDSKKSLEYRNELSSMVKLYLSQYL